MWFGNDGIDTIRKSDFKGGYFYDCEQNGYSDFETWCEDNIQNDEQESLLYEMLEHVNAIAGILFLE